MSDLRDRVIREITVVPGWNKEDATALVDALPETALRDEGHETTREDDRLWSQSFARISRRPTMSDRELTSLELVEAFERESGAFDGPSVNVSPPHPGIVPTWPRLIRERALAEAAPHPLDGLREAARLVVDRFLDTPAALAGVHVAALAALVLVALRDEGETT